MLLSQIFALKTVDQLINSARSRRPMTSETVTLLDTRLGGFHAHCHVSHFNISHVRDSRYQTSLQGPDEWEEVDAGATLNSMA